MTLAAEIPTVAWLAIGASVAMILSTVLSLALIGAASVVKREDIRRATEREDIEP